MSQDKATDLETQAAMKGTKINVPRVVIITEKQGQENKKVSQIDEKKAERVMEIALARKRTERAKNG